MIVILVFSSIKKQSKRRTVESFLPLEKISWAMNGVIHCSGYLKNHNEWEWC
ncbi:MAG: hypothetical protein ACI9RO_001502 [Alteromonas macleodii]|jgi:hypothetical protein